MRRQFEKSRIGGIVALRNPDRCDTTCRKSDRPIYAFRPAHFPEAKDAVTMQRYAIQTSLLSLRYVAQ
jgi:hypothetical protein